MFVINEDKSIYITRGDVAFFSIEAKTDTGEKYKFMPGDVVRFKVFERKACENVVLSKDFGIETEAEEVSIYLEEKDTKFGEVISKPVEYWYEVELNPYTDPQTILGYDEDGAKVFKLFPEGNEKEDDDPITPEDIPVVDEELDLTSTRPVQNQAIARAILKINEDVKAELSNHSAAMNEEIKKAEGEVEKAKEEVKKVENLFLQDISADFFEEGNDYSFDEVKVYKQGNVIFGSLYGSYDTDIQSGLCLFPYIKPAYRPVCDIIAPVLLMEIFMEGDTYKSSRTTPTVAMFEDSGGIAIIKSSDGAAKNGINITFTYVTAE